MCAVPSSRETSASTVSRTAALVKLTTETERGAVGVDIYAMVSVLLSVDLSMVGVDAIMLAPTLGVITDAMTRSESDSDVASIMTTTPISSDNTTISPYLEAVEFHFLHFSRWSRLPKNSSAPLSP